MSTILPLLLSLVTLMSIIRTGRTDRPYELCFNFFFFFISSDFSQMGNFPTCIPGSDFHSPALLDFLISSDASNYYKMAFPPLTISLH